MSPVPELEMHDLAKLFHLAAAHRHLKLQVAQAQNVGVIKPWLYLANFIQVDAKGAVAAEKLAGRQPGAKLGDVHRHYV